MKNGTDVELLPLEKVGVFAGYLTELIIKGGGMAKIDYLLGHKKEVKKKISELFDLVVDEYTEIREDWEKFYKNFLGWSVSFSDVVIPTIPTEGSWRLLFIAKNLTPNKVFDAWTFKKWRYTEDLDANVTENVRKASYPYAIWVQDNIEPDAEFLGKSTKNVDPDMKIGVTLLERMIHEAKYFSETGNHLDVKGVTFCSGSRNSGGVVPYVNLYSDGLVYVNWCYLGFSSAYCGIRRAVTL